jgi:hypothetical protein
MHATRTAAFLLLDVLLVLCLCSMILCMHPIRLEFVSEWMRQCQDDELAYVIPVVLAGLLVLVVVLQLDWMYRVSLHHLHAIVKLDVIRAWQSAAERVAPSETRTFMVVKLLDSRAKARIVCTDGHSDAAFVASFAAVVGIAAIVHYNWNGHRSWLHYYGVVLFCAGFFVMLQIVWLNLQRASAIASLRSMPPVRGLHWLVDVGILLLLLFLAINVTFGRIGPLVVASELLGFALLLFQFLYVFQACCRSGEPAAVQRSAAWPPRVLVCVLLLVPFAWPQSLK